MSKSQTMSDLTCQTSDLTCAVATDVRSTHPDAVPFESGQALKAAKGALKESSGVRVC